MSSDDKSIDKTKNNSLGRKEFAAGIEILERQNQSKIQAKLTKNAAFSGRKDACVNKMISTMNYQKAQF